MRVERDIAGIALPFTFGTASFLYAADHLAAGTHLAASASFCAAIISLFFLIHFHSHKTDSTLVWITVIVAMTACGFMTASTRCLTSLSDKTEAGWFTSAAIGFAERMKTAIDSIPFSSDRTGHLLKALLTGDRSGLSHEVTEAFRGSGASHILALSGLHLGIIYGMVRLLTRCLGNSRTSQVIRSVTLVGVCGFYTLATGAGASITRAFIFIAIGECIRLSRRQANLKNTVMAALVIHLALMPKSIMEIGFQLSYAAIFGIAFIFPWMSGFWPGERSEDGWLARSTRWIWDSAAMSISCQVTTAPLAYIYFGTFPTQFILTNMIALPLTGIIIPMSLATVAASALGWHPQMLTFATEWTVNLLCESLDLLSTM